MLHAPPKAAIEAPFGNPCPMTAPPFAWLSLLPMRASPVSSRNVLPSRAAQSLRAAAGTGLLASGGGDADLWGDVDGAGAWAGGGDGGNRAVAVVHWR